MTMDRHEDGIEGLLKMADTLVPLAKVNGQEKCSQQQLRRPDRSDDADHRALVNADAVVEIVTVKAPRNHKDQQGSAGTR